MRSNNTSTPLGAAKLALASLAGRWLSLTEEITQLDTHLAALVESAAPSLLDINAATRNGGRCDTGGRLAAGAGYPFAAGAGFTAAVLRDWGIDAAGLAEVRNIAANFVRVSPVNLVTGACLTLLLGGARPSGPGFADGWMPPSMLPPMPGNVDLAAVPEVSATC